MKKINLKTVTVIIPSYNVGKFLQHTLNSLKKQTLSDFLAIIVDDGSSDNTYDVAMQYASKDPRFTVLQKNNGGVSSARNYGLDNINSTFFTFIDGDDIVDKEYLSRLVYIANNYNVDIVSSNVKSTTITTSPTDVIQSPDIEIINSQQAVCGLLYNKGIHNSSCAKLYRTDRLKRLRFDEALTIGEDMEYVFRAFKAANSIAICKDEMYFYVQRDSSAMHKSFDSRKADGYRAAKKILSNKRLSNDEQKAANAKIFTEAFSALVLMKGYERQFIALHKQLIKSIEKYAHEVARNAKARKIQRIYAILCIINPGIATTLAHLKKKLIEIRH